MLRKTTVRYDERRVGQKKAEYDVYWNTIVQAVETSEFEELMAFAREAGRHRSSQGFELSDVIGRMVEATNAIEIALLEANEGAIPPMEVVHEIAELRSMIVMAVADGYKSDQESKRTVVSHEAQSKDQLRSVMLRPSNAFKVTELAAGEEIAPLYEGEMKFYFVDYGTLRLYNLLPNARCITLSILGKSDVFVQWRAEAQSLSCLCAEALLPSRVISVGERDMSEVLAVQTSAAIDVIASFARRLTESQVLIEDLMNNSVNIRLYRTLLELSKQFGRREGSYSVIDYPLTHQRLADMIGSNRVTITRKLHDLQERGIIETRKNATIVLKDGDGLWKLAENSSSPRLSRDP